MTGELFSLLKEHSILADLLQGDGRANDVFKARRATRSAMRRFPPNCSRSARGVLLGQAKKEDAASYASGLLIGTDVRIGLRHARRRADPVMGRPELTRLYAAAIAEAGARGRRARRRDNASLPAFTKLRRGST